MIVTLCGSAKNLDLGNLSHVGSDSFAFGVGGGMSVTDIVWGWVRVWRRWWWWWGKWYEHDHHEVFRSMSNVPVAAASLTEV